MACIFGDHLSRVSSGIGKFFEPLGRTNTSIRPVAGSLTDKESQMESVGTYIMEAARRLIRLVAKLAVMSVFSTPRKLLLSSVSQSLGSAGQDGPMQHTKGFTGLSSLS